MILLHAWPSCCDCHPKGTTQDAAHVMGMLAPKKDTNDFIALELPWPTHDLGDMLNAHSDGLTETTYAGNINYWILPTFSINNSLSSASQFFISGPNNFHKLAERDPKFIWHATNSGMRASSFPQACPSFQGGLSWQHFLKTSVS